MKTKEVNYFDLFIDAAKVCNKAAIELDKMFKNMNDSAKYIAIIHNIEHEGDELHHTLCAHLKKSFITPIERDDILSIARYIEETIDTIDEVAIMFNMLSIEKIREEAKEFVDLIVKASKCLIDTTIEFKNYKKSKELVNLLVEINHIEEQGDRLYENAIKTLFSKESDVMEVIRWKNVFDVMEDVLDAIENVSDIMEGVIVNNS